MQLIAASTSSSSSSSSFSSSSNSSGGRPSEKMDCMDGLQHCPQVPPATYTHVKGKEHHHHRHSPPHRRGRRHHHHHHHGHHFVELCHHSPPLPPPSHCHERGRLLPGKPPKHSSPRCHKIRAGCKLLRVKPPKHSKKVRKLLKRSCKLPKKLGARHGHHHHHHVHFPTPTAEGDLHQHPSGCCLHLQTSCIEQEYRSAEEGCPSGCGIVGYGHHFRPPHSPPHPHKRSPMRPALVKSQVVKEVSLMSPIMEAAPAEPPNKQAGGPPPLATTSGAADEATPSTLA